MTAVAVVGASESVAELRTRLASHAYVIVSDDPRGVTDAMIDRLVSPAGDGVATTSPVPLESCREPHVYELHDASPPPPSIALPCPRLCLIDTRAVASVTGSIPSADSAAEWVAALGEVFLQHGWRNVVAPGLALAWDPADMRGTQPVAGWSRASVTSLVGPANTGLEAHRSWARAQVDSVRLVIDGACLTDGPYTGTQVVVTELAKWMAKVRPGAEVVLGVRSSMVDNVRRSLDGTSVEVTARHRDVVADVLYRPYQMLYARELGFVVETGRRTVVGQLDMIGFSNPWYHPSDQLFFFARNIQRHLMRSADGVTFISTFGRDSAFTECPDLDSERLHVVSCGADAEPKQGTLGKNRTIDGTTPFVACLSSTFWHKNRAHAIATFAALVSEHGYAGDLVIAGPEPYFGRSIAAEDAVIDALEPAVRRRVHRWGHVGENEKWWLLEHAQAVLYPSIIEGFGLVPFEAAAVGTPALAYAGTAQRELLHSTSALIDSWDPQAWAGRVNRMISDPSHGAFVVDELTAAAHRFTWQRCAERTWTAVDHALASPRRVAVADDGAMLARIDAAGRVRRAGTALRFDAARGLPAVGRRVRRAATRLERRRS